MATHNSRKTEIWQRLNLVTYNGNTLHFCIFSRILFLLRDKILIPEQKEIEFLEASASSKSNESAKPSKSKGRFCSEIVTVKFDAARSAVRPPVCRRRRQLRPVEATIGRHSTRRLRICRGEKSKI